MTSDPTLPALFQAARADETLVVLEGFHALKHALRFGADIQRIVVADREALADLARQLAPDVAARLATAEAVPLDLFRRLAVPTPETGVLAVARRRITPFDALADRPHRAPVVLLEEPTHLGNIGAVIRVAAGAGADAVLCTGPHDPWHPTAVRGAAGLHYALPVLRAEHVALPGRSLIAVDPEGESIEHVAIPAAAILAFGSERRGLSPTLKARADRMISIPMEPGVSSLNLATSVAVILYTWRLSSSS